MPITHFLFDLDGVLTDKHSRLDRKIVSTLVGLVKKGHDVDIATGRSMEFVMKFLWPELEKATARLPKLRERFVFNAENGVDVVMFHGGKPRARTFKDRGLSKKEKAEFLGIAKKLQLAILCNEKDKRHMLTFHAPENFRGRDFEKVQLELDELEKAWRPAIERHPHLHQRRSVYAVDVVALEAEKDQIGERILRESGADTRFVVIGDSPADLFLSKPFVNQGKKVEIWHVGEPDKLSPAIIREKLNSPGVKIRFSRQLYNRGTHEILKRF